MSAFFPTSKLPMVEPNPRMSAAFAVAILRISAEVMADGLRHVALIILAV